jgi:hypothetical protein
MKDTSIRHAPKPTACDYQKEQEGLQKKSEALLQSKAQNNGQEKENNPCLECSTFSQELEAQASQETDWESKQPNLLKSIPTHSKSSDTTFPIFPSTTILEPTIQPQESSILSGIHSPAQAQVTQEAEQDYLTQSQHFGEKDLDVLSKLNPASVLSNNLKELSNEDFELFLVDSLWQDTVLRLKQSRQQSLGRVIKDSDYLSFPTLTSNDRSTSRPAGQTKCEKWFKDKGLIPNGSQLSAQAIASLMNFPTDWFSPLSPVKLQAELEPDISQDEPLPQDKQPLPSVESSISIPCLVKQPGQDEVKGVIQKDLGDRFVVEVDGKTISISKLFVYPDFSETVGQIEKNPSKISTPSKNNPRKNRRRKNGQGNGSIYYRTVTKNGKQYQEAYYHYLENGKKRTKYIPRKLLDRVSEAESRSLPVADILFLLGGDKKNPRKSFSTLSTEADEQPKTNEVLETDKNNPRKITPPSKRRKQGDGTGYIECKPIKRSEKEYQQYWYHYEEWSSGDRLSKKSKYIPKTMLNRIEQMNNEKAPVEEILKVLRDRSKRKVT